MNEKLIKIAREVSLQQARKVLEPDDFILKVLESTFAYVDVPRMLNLRARCQSAPEGAFVECGVAQGASLALMAAYAGDRQVWGFDSFEGLPELSEGDDGDGAGVVGFKCSGDRGIDAVTETFDSLGISMDNTRLVKGWFDESIPTVLTDIGDISVLRLDSDFHDSTLYTLEVLYPLVVEGGSIIIDDYFTFVGCRTAVDGYRQKHGIEDELIVTHEKSEVWWTKSS